MNTPLISLTRRLAPLAVVLATISLAGCSADPRSLLDEMSLTYRKAQTYSDNARVRIRYTREGTEVDQSIPFRLAFERPDRLRIDCYDARIAADGTSLRAAVGNVPGQVLEEPVRSPLTLDQLFADEQVRLTLAEGDAGCPTQLPLLLADDTVDLIVADAVDKPRITGTEQIEGHACTVVLIPKPDGPLVLWIDRTKKLLRRMSLPTAAYGQFLTQQGGPVGGLSVIVDFLEAKFPASVPSEAFVFEVPAGAARVDRLEPPPTPQPPSALVGKSATPFVLAALDGTTVSSESLSGSTVVLDFFHTDCDACRRSMPQVAKAVETFTAGGAASPMMPVKHFAVSVDETDVPDEALREKVRQWDGTKTILRDPRSVAATGFEITTFPAVVVLTPAGTVADVLLSHDHLLAKDLSATLTAVATGTPTGPLLRDRFDTRLREYRALLEKVAGGGEVERLPPQQIAPRRQPDRFKLVRAWRAEGVAMPGNVACFDDGGALRIIALDGWRTVVVLDPSGRELARHELDLPADAAVGFLRTAVDANGKRWWLGGNRGGQQVFVFDDTWKLHAAYPGWESPSHAGIRTAQLVDLNDDGTPEVVVGYYGTVGVQAASLDGHRLWRERSFDTVLDVVPDAPRPEGSRGLVCVNGHGRIVPVTMEGRGAEARPVEGAGQGAGEGRPQPDWTMSPAVASLFAGPVAPDGAWAFLGLSSPSMGKNVAVGLGPLPDQFWELDLPDGVHRDGPIEPVAWADLLGTPRRQWLIAAPDGSVTVAWADGRVVDRYRHGAPLVGIGGYRDGNDGVIVIATRDSLEGYRVDDVALD